MIVPVYKQIDALYVLQQATAVVQLAIRIVANVADAYHQVAALAAQLVHLRLSAGEYSRTWLPASK